MRLFQHLSAASGSRFRKNFLQVARANVLALALPLLATPLLTRLYSPDDFGSLAIFISLLSLTLAFCTWRFDWSIPNARSRTMAASLFTVGAIVLSCVTLLMCLVYLLFRGDLVRIDGFVDVGLLILLFPVALVAGGLRLLLSGWFVRLGNLSPVSRATIAQSTTNTVAGLSAGFLGAGAAGLIGANVLSNWAGIGTLAREARGLKSSLMRVSATRIRAGLARYRGEATWSTLVAILNAVSLSAPVLLFAKFYSVQEVGWYSLMYRVVAAPTGALASALGQSFWAYAAELARGQKFAELNSLYRKVTFRLGLSCIPVVTICLAGPYFVGPVLGEEWYDAGYVLLAMTPLFIGSIMFAPTNHLVVLNRQALQTFSDGVRLGLTLCAIVVASLLHLDFVMAVFMAAASSLLGNLLLFFIHLKEHARHGT